MKGHKFPADFGFSGSAGSQPVRGYMRGGAVKHAKPVKKALGGAMPLRQGMPAPAGRGAPAPQMAARPSLGAPPPSMQKPMGALGALSPRMPAMPPPGVGGNLAAAMRANPNPQPIAPPSYGGASNWAGGPRPSAPPSGPMPAGPNLGSIGGPKTGFRKGGKVARKAAGGMMPSDMAGIVGPDSGGGGPAAVRRRGLIAKVIPPAALMAFMQRRGGRGAPPSDIPQTATPPRLAAKGGWISGAIKKPGALHKQLGVPPGEKIPAKKLATAANAPGKLGQRARLAETLKGMNHARGGGIGPKMPKMPKIGGGALSQVTARPNFSLRARLPGGMKRGGKTC